MDIRAKKECLFIRDLISLSKKFFRLEEAIRKGVLELEETLYYKWYYHESNEIILELE